MTSRTRRLTRRRRFLTGLVVGFATLVVFSAPASAKLMPPAPTTQYENGGVVMSTLLAEHYRRDQRAADLAGTIVPQTKSVSAKPVVSSTAAGSESNDWTQGIVLAFVLIAASAFAVFMVRGGVRTANS